MPKFGKEKKFVVYKLLFPNGKVYIGISSCSFRKRMNEHKCKATNKDYSKIGNAVKKYGWDNIIKSIVIEDTTKEIACKMESDLIKESNATDINLGYNTALGGEINCGYKHPNPNYNKHLSSERRKEISKIAIESRKAQPDYKEKLSDALSRFPVIVKNIKTGELIEFKNASKCEDYFGYCRGRVYDHVMRNSKLLDKKLVVRRKIESLNLLHNN